MRRILAITALAGSVLALAAGILVAALGLLWGLPWLSGGAHADQLMAGIGGLVALGGLVLAGLGGFEFALVADAQAAGARSALHPGLRLAAVLAGTVVALAVWSSVGGPPGLGIVIALLLVAPPVAGVIVSVHARRAVIALLALAMATLPAASSIAGRVESDRGPERAVAMRTFATQLDVVASLDTGPDWTIVSAGVLSTGAATLVDETWGITRFAPLGDAPQHVIEALTGAPVRIVVVLQCRGSAEPVRMQFSVHYSGYQSSPEVEAVGEPAARCNGESHLQRLGEDVSVPDPSVDRGSPCSSTPTATTAT